MYICICNAVSEAAIRQAVADGVRTMEQLRMRTGCSTVCGCCEPIAAQVLEECLQERAESAPRRDDNVVLMRQSIAMR